MRTASCIAAAALALCLGCAARLEIGARQPRARASTGANRVTSIVDWKRFAPNESGVVPILEYHGISDKPSRYERTVKQFGSDLQKLYDLGYRPVLLERYLDNRIDAPLGTSPVIVTFDDSRASQFRYLPNGSIDPGCAVGIWQAFARMHPDFPLRATFFVVPGRSGDREFGTPSEAGAKLRWLLNAGCELGDHTLTHPTLSHLADEQVQKEIAGCLAAIHKLAPGAQVDTLALPRGIAPRNRRLLAAGAYGRVSYSIRAVLLVGASPAPSPVSRRFRPMMLPRIQPVNGAFGMEFWLKDLQRHPGRRYVSDGDPLTVTVPAADAALVDRSRLNGATLRIY
ncbi:MAG TPA: polysaccharide deacetylase family protein [Chthonomonadales bacterium]|nr:polysaccharide deacetylase family protein [Chthonomonadales bacterium]